MLLYVTIYYNILLCTTISGIPNLSWCWPIWGVRHIWLAARVSPSRQASVCDCSWVLFFPPGACGAGGILFLFNETNRYGVPSKNFFHKTNSFYWGPATLSFKFCKNDAFGGCCSLRTAPQRQNGTSLVATCASGGPLLHPTPLPSINLVRKLTGQWDP